MVEHKINWEIDIAKIITIIAIILLLIFGYQQVSLVNKVDSLKSEISDIKIQLEDNAKLIESLNTNICIRSKNG